MTQLARTTQFSGKLTWLPELGTHKPTPFSRDFGLSFLDQYNAVNRVLTENMLTSISFGPLVTFSVQKVVSNFIAGKFRCIIKTV